MELMDLKLSIIYRVLKAIEQKGQLTISEIIALVGSSTFHQKYLPYLVENGFLVSEKRREGRRTIRLIRITGKGRKLLSLLEEIEKLEKG